MPEANDLPNDDGVVDGDPQGSAETTNQTQDGGESEAENGAVTQEAESAEKPINLNELEEFKQYQASVDRRLAETEQRYQQQLAEAQNALVAKMSEEERVQFQSTQTQAELERLRSQLNRTKEEQEFFDYVADVQNRTGAPTDAIDMTSFQSVTDSAYQWKVQQLEQKVAEASKGSPANRVDVGQSKTPTPPDAGEELRKLAQSDTQAFYKAILNQ